MFSVFRQVVSQIDRNGKEISVPSGPVGVVNRECDIQYAAS
jgi:hypothetical protein